MKNALELEGDIVFGTQPKGGRGLAFWAFLTVGLTACGWQPEPHLLQAPLTNPPSPPAYEWARLREATLDSAARTIAQKVVGPHEVLLHTAPQTFLHAGKRIWRATIVDVVSGKVRKIAIDDAGDPVDRHALWAIDHQLATAKRGKLGADLWSKLQTTKPTASIAVQIWHRVDGLVPWPADPSKPTASLWRQTAKAQIAGARVALLQRLAAHAANIKNAMEQAPIIEASLTPSQIAAFKADPDVVAIRASRRHLPSFPLTFSSSLDMFLESFYDYGERGQGIKVGITEACRECGIWFGNPSLAFPAVQKKLAYHVCTIDDDCPYEGFTEGPRCIAGICYGAHPTWVAGMLGARYPFWPNMLGGAPDVTIVHGNDANATHAELLEWVLQQGAQVVNESWGGTSTDWWAIDWFARYNGLTVVRAAGNSATEIVNCRSFNALCVGAYDIGQPQDWYDDTFWPSTSTLNLTSCAGGSPTGCDREMPHITAHGMNCATTSLDTSDSDGISTTYVPPSTGVTTPLQGTSLAAPAITALVALLQQRDATFRSWPQAVRAVLMASAVHDVDTPVGGKTYSDYRAPDEKDGAGVPDARAIARVINLRVSSAGYQTALLTPSDFTNGEREFVNVWVPAGSTLRAVISWPSCPTGYGYSNPAPILPGPAADFDLLIKDWSRPAATLAYGGSWDGGYEIVEHTPTASGYFRIFVKHYAWTACAGLSLEPLALAYNVYP